MLALLNDLVFIAESPGADWAALADSAIDHHSPQVEVGLLSEPFTDIQILCHTALRAMVNGDVRGIERVFLDLRQLEGIDEMLGQKLQL